MKRVLLYLGLLPGLYSVVSLTLYALAGLVLWMPIGNDPTRGLMLTLFHCVSIVTGAFCATSLEEMK